MPYWLKIKPIQPEINIWKIRHEKRIYIINDDGTVGYLYFLPYLIPYIRKIPNEIQNNAQSKIEENLYT